MALPSLTIAMEGTPTSNSVTLRGTITDTGGFPIIERGFWIRPYGSFPERAEWVNTASNTFSAVIRDLQPNTRYVARAVARNSSGLPGHGQSGQLIFTTPAVPGNATVTFNPNGGNVNPPTRAVQIGTQLGSYPTPTRAGGHTFAGWWTHINNNVTSGTRISPLITIQSNVTYHARWNSTVTFNSAEGNLSIADRTRTVQSNTAVGALPTPTREGHFFVGWFPPAGNTQITDGTIVNGNITYTARWVNNAPNSFTITYRDPHVSGVTGQLPSQQTVTIGRAVNLANNLNNRQRQGYILAGWSTQNRINHRDPEFTLSQRNVMFTGTGDVVLYAHWAPRHWTNVRNVNVQLYADYLFDRGVYNNRNNYLTNLRTISRNAAVPFYRTFGINMNISNNIIEVRSIKYYCCDNHMTSPLFVCTIHTIDAPPTFPSNWNQFFTEHHSSGDLMIHMFDTMPSTSHGLHTMFFAGVICSRRGPGGSTTRHGGMAMPRGNTSINSSSAFEFYNRPENFSNPRVATRIVQHEWSHNYGAGDPNCLVHCIMDGGSWFTVPQDIDNLWCYRCREDIIINRTRH